MKIPSRQSWAAKIDNIDPTLFEEPQWFSDYEIEEAIENNDEAFLLFLESMRDTIEDLD